MKMRLLLLAGTPEARQIAAALAAEDRVITRAALAKPSVHPQKLGVPTRIGGWGGRAEFQDWVERLKITAILDATHPFAANISHRAHSVAEELGISYIQFMRRPWTPGPEDNWAFLNSEEEAAARFLQTGNIYLGTGLRKIDVFAKSVSPASVWVPVDRIPDMAFPFAEGSFIRQGSFKRADDLADFFTRHEISHVVTRNSGNGGDFLKIDVARRLRLPVAMIRRPKQPDALRLNTVSEALAWVRYRL